MLNVATSARATVAAAILQRSKRRDVPGAEVLRQQRRRCFLSLHFLFKDLTHYQE